MRLFCPACGQRWDFTPERLWCACGHPLLWDSLMPFDVRAIVPNRWSLWRYQAMLALPTNTQPISLGEGMTPLLPTPDRNSWFKLEYLNPTGSFKDRGASVLVTGLKGWGIEEVAEDSSGNAGVALATYAKAAEISCRIFVPKTAAPGKIAALQRFGAKVVFCETRQEAAERVREVTKEGIYYASHTWHPLYLQGTKTVAYEIAEQLDWRVDDRFAIFVPVGNGDLLLGIHLGFLELQRAGVIPSVPRLIAIQALACAPIYAAAHGLELPLGKTVAEGVAVPQPPRLRQILAAVQATGGEVIAVSEPAILNAVDELSGLGLWVEPTGALAWAAWNQLGKPPNSLLLLTGAGWKTLRP